MGKIFFDKIRLGSGHSLILGNTPDKLDIEKVSTFKPTLKLDIENFGLFESAAPNFNTYYPEVTSEDIAPKGGDFILPIFRALSEVIVHKRSNPIDFSENSALRNSMNKLKGQTIFPNHEPIVGNEIGAVSAVSWQESYTSNGIRVPAGINAQMKVDAKSNPKIARNIMMDPPAIHSTSVTVEFGWEPSHTFSDMNEFWNMLGKMGKDKKLVRRIVTEVRNYHEISFVSHGADPFAQKVNEQGNIVNPEYANEVYSFAALGKEAPAKYYFDFKDKESLSAEPSTPPKSNNINNIQPMKDLIAKLALQYKVAEELITEQFIAEKLIAGETAITELATAKETHTMALAAETKKVNDLTAELAIEKVAKETAEAELAKVKPVADTFITNLREETKRVYKLIKGDKADEVILTSFDTSSDIQLSALLKDYNTELEEKFPASCKDCNSTNVARNTAEIKTPGTPNPKKVKSVEEVNEELRAEAKQGFIFDKGE